MLKHLLSLVFPDSCVHCQISLLKTERYVCTTCYYQIHQVDFKQQENQIINRVFYGKVPVEKAFSLFYFIKGGVGQSIIHHLKYKNKGKLGIYFGEKLGAEIFKTFDFQDIDAIVPVPLGAGKKRKRGYNQSEKIARGISLQLNKPVLPELLLRIKQKKSQTQYNKFTRWQNIYQCFEVNAKVQQSYQHILLVDDVITTGATIESCVVALLEKGNVKVSVASLAYAPQPL